MTSLSTYLIYRKEWALKWAVTMLIILVLAFLSNQYLHSKLLTIIFLILLLLPFIFMKKMMNYFTRKVIVQLNENEIFFNITKPDNDTDEHILAYKLSDITSYQIQFPNNRFACLILTQTSGKKKEFSFRRQTLNDTQMNADVVIESIHKIFARHNVEFAPSFYASQTGLYTIIGLLILLCIPFGIAASLNRDLPATIIGSVFLVGIVIFRRMNDLSFYKKWKKAR